MRYLLDTNICIYIANRKPASVESRLAQLSPGDVGMSVVSYLELIYGAWKSGKRQYNLDRIERLCTLIPVLPLTAEVGESYGRLRAQLEKSGTPVGAYDMLIASHAQCLDLTLITNNDREFRRIPGLKVENWV